MAVFEGFEAAAFTIQALRLYQDLAPDQLEILVVDNCPTGVDAERMRQFCDKSGARYVPFSEVIGTSAPRDHIFQVATGEIVCVIDAHVLLVPGALRQLLKFAQANPANMDLWHGPMLMDELGDETGSTHMVPEWGEDLMFGKWSSDARGFDLHATPFEIPMHGLGLFACRRAAWLGFPPGLRGFGGEEGMIHDKFRQNGRRVLCLPFLRWWHLFRDPRIAPPFSVTVNDRLRNYLIWAQHLSLDVAAVIDRFRGHLPASQLEDVLQSLADGPPTLERLYERAARTPSDINEHCPTLRRLASQAAHVTEFGMRHGVSTVSLLAAQPARLVTYDLVRSPEVEILQTVAGATSFEFRLGDSLSVEIESTDLLFVDTRHTEAQLTEELARHAFRVRRWIVLHDTQIFGEVGEDGGPGLLPALRQFLSRNRDWTIAEEHFNNHGLTVLARSRGTVPTRFPFLRNVWRSSKTLMRSLTDHH